MIHLVIYHKDIVLSNTSVAFDMFVATKTARVSHKKKSVIFFFERGYILLKPKHPDYNHLRLNPAHSPEQNLVTHPNTTPYD
jgi:hypothetical protein